MNDENKVKTNAFDKILKDKKTRFFIVAILVVAVFVIMFANFGKKSSDATQLDETEAYVSRIENTLSEILSEIRGAGKVSVAVSVESGRETVLAVDTTVTQTDNGTIKEEKLVIINGKTVTVKELYPKITGVLIVAEGADSLAVVRKIQQATTSLLDIDVSRIEILTMK